MPRRSRPATASRRAPARASGRARTRFYAAVRSLAVACGASGLLVDVGCGTGNLWRALAPLFTACIGVDTVRYYCLPAGVDFRQADLDRDRLPVDDGVAGVCAAVETIEHLENPRALVRELTRVCRSGGWVIVTTPNQLSVLSLLTLIVKQRFPAFQDASYPAHRTALLEVDLRRIAAECGLTDVRILFTMRGRVPLSGAHYPVAIARLFPRGFSDNVVLMARKP